MTSKLLFTVLFLFSINGLTQIYEGNAFLIGNFINVAIDSAKGKEGTGTGGGFHYRGGAPGTPCGLVADPNETGWDSELFHGDFFTAGSPENGFGLEINGTNYNNNAGGADDDIVVHAGYPLYSEEGSCMVATWYGEVEGIEMKIVYRLKENDLFYTMNITLYNTTEEDLIDLYYYRNVDPDNNQSIGGTFHTNNTVVAQPNEMCQKALVTATQELPIPSFLAFGAVGENFRVSHGGFSNRSGSDIWNGTGVLTNVVGESVHEDKAISLAYKTDLAAGDTVNFSYAIILDEDALDDAFSDFYYPNFLTIDGEIAEPWSECDDIERIDTVVACPGDTVMFYLTGENVDDYNWIWTPATGLTTDTGDTTFVVHDEMITYTVSSDPLDCVILEPKKIVFKPAGLVATISEDITISIGESTTLVATGGDSYSWFPFDGLSDPFESTTEATPDETTLYSVIVSNEDGFCPDDTLSVLVTVINELLVGQLKQELISIYPNPLSTSTTIDFGEKLTSPHTIIVYDAIGKTVYCKHDIMEKQIQLDDLNLDSGTYFIGLLDNQLNQIWSEKLIVR